MGDKRTDPGQFYPGGRVIARRGVAPPQIIVQWSDVQGKPQIAPLPDRYRDSDVKEKVNEIASKFATVVVAALIGWTACADITVQKKRKDQIYNDEQVVVDVTGSGVGVDTNAVRTLIDTSFAGGTNAVNAAIGEVGTNIYTKADADAAATAKANAAIAAAGCVTNNQTLVGKHLSFMESVSAEDDGYTEYTTAGITTKFLGSKFYHGSYT